MSDELSNGSGITETLHLDYTGITCSTTCWVRKSAHSTWISERRSAMAAARVATSQVEISVEKTLYFMRRFRYAEENNSRRYFSRACTRAILVNQVLTHAAELKSSHLFVCLYVCLATVYVSVCLSIPLSDCLRD